MSLCIEHIKWAAYKSDTIHCLVNAFNIYYFKWNVHLSVDTMVMTATWCKVWTYLDFRNV